MRRLIAIYREEPTLHRRRFFHGKSLHGEQSPEIAWLDPTGKEMSGDALESRLTSAAWACISWAATSTSTNTATPIIGDHLLILFNADHEQAIPFALPKLSADCGHWQRLFDTALDKIDVEPPKAKGEEILGTYKVLPCSMVVFRALVPRETFAS